MKAHRGHASWRALRDARERRADISLALRLQDQRLAHENRSTIIKPPPPNGAAECQANYAECVR
jgi:hypothetical protein